MADARAVIERIRSFGANVLVGGSKLTVINKQKLPPGALRFITENGRDIAAFLEREAECDERAAIIQYDGGLNRPVAEYLARLLMSSPPDGVNRTDWSWFVEQAMQIIDRFIPRKAA
jgi:hypothetical protein